jgi:hypothetical protein
MAGKEVAPQPQPRERIHRIRYAPYPAGQAFSAETARPAAHCSRTLQEQIDRPAAALLALAFELAVAHQTIEPRADLAIIGGADQPRDRCAG